MLKGTEIKNIKDLMTYVKFHGIDGDDIERINRYADILGNTPIGELAEAANKDRNTFFFIARLTWGPTDMIEFFMNHCSLKYKQLEEDSEYLKSLEKEHKKLAAERDDLHQQRTALMMQKEAMQIKINNQARDLEDAKLEIIKLKAELYDLKNNKE